MTQYGTFWEAYKALHPNSKYTPAGQTWTPTNLQGLANAYSSLNPTWTPPADQNAALPQPIKPVQFDPYGDLSYAATASAGQTATQHAQAERDYQYGRGAQAYGYNAQGALDPTNPYSQAAILKHNYDNSVRGTTNSYASAGQLYSGALTNAQNTNDWNYGVSSDQLKRGAQDFYHAQDMNVQNVSDQSLAALAAALGPAFQNFLASLKG